MAGKTKTYQYIVGGGNPPAEGKAAAGINPELREGGNPPAEGKAAEIPGSVPAVDSAPTAKAVALEQDKPDEYAPPKRLSYTEIYNALNPYTPPTQEDLEKEKKKKKRDELFAAIGDGISAIANLGFTAAGGPSIFQAKESATEKTRMRYERLKKEREAAANAYITGLFGAMKADDARDASNRSWQRTLNIDKHNIERQQRLDKQAADAAAAKSQRDEAMAALNMQLMLGKISAQEAEARKKNIEAEYAERNQQSIIDKNNRTGGTRTGSGSSRKYTLQIGDETKEYGSVTDYNRDVESYAEYYGIDLYVYEGNGRNKKQKRKPTAQLAAEVEKASGVVKNAPRGEGNDDTEGRKPNPMSDGKKKNPMS